MHLYLLYLCMYLCSVCALWQQPEIIVEPVKRCIAGRCLPSRSSLQGAACPARRRNAPVPSVCSAVLRACLQQDGTQ